MRTSILALSACMAAVFISSPRETTAVRAWDAPRAAGDAPHVAILALPAGGIQPQAVVDAEGSVHVVYFSGEPSGGDLYYIRMARGERTMSAPVRVNSIAGSALATGSVRGAQLSMGRNGRVHIAWHGSKPVTAKDSDHVPMWYARDTIDAARFEPQRVVSGKARGLDGGTVAADRSGHVVVAWHAAGVRPGEGNRTVYLARSSDDGATFSAPAAATSAPVGACGCCGMRALFDRQGALHLLYRAATGGTHRDTTWLMLDGAAAHPPVRLHPWQLEACPMTTYSLAETPTGVAAVWETAQQIYSAALNPATHSFSAPVAVPGQGGARKHPSMAVNAGGDTLIAWTEGTAWKRGGTFAWRVTDGKGTERAANQNAGVVPTWGLVSAVALADGSFAIIK